MVLRYFRKSDNAPPEDAGTQNAVESENVSDTPVDASVRQTEKDPPKSGAQSEPPATLLPSTEVSYVEAQGQMGHPVLSDEDALFLRQVVSNDEEEAPPLPPRPEKVEPLTPEQEQSTDASEEKATTKSSISWRDRWDQYRQSQDRTSAANDLMSAAVTLKAASDAGSESESEVKSEQRDVKTILARLDLSAINNRVVGISGDTQKLLESFNQVLKDIINGVPTAYDDLEKLLKDRQGQLDKLFGTLPPFLQKLVKSLPTKSYAYFAPQIAAAMAAGKTADSKRSDKESAEESPEEGKKKKKFLSIPNLKDLVMQKGAVVAMLRSIVSFLETRFPAMLAGTNVIMSLAVFVLLFVFWYCYKRGRESRLAKETSESLENSTNDLESGTIVEEKPEGIIPVQEGSLTNSDAQDPAMERKVELLAQEIEKKP